MKRVLIAVVTIGVCAAAFYGFRSRATQMRATAQRNELNWRTQTQEIESATAERATLEERIRTNGIQANVGAPVQRLNQDILALKPYYESSKYSWYLQPESSAALLAALGFDWHTTGGFVVVSKPTLLDIRVPDVSNGKLSDAAATVLALTPSERGAVDALIHQAEQAFQGYLKAHVRHEEPAGDYLLKLTIPGDAAFSESLNKQFTYGIAAAVGSEREHALLRYTATWNLMMNLNNKAGDPISVAVHSYGRDARGPMLEVVLHCQGNDIPTPIRPNEPVPLIVRLLYPGGWEELGQRENLELPKPF